MKRRGNVIFILLLIVALGLPGCATDDQDSGAISLWHSYRGDEQAALETLVGQWNREHPDAPVKTLALPYDAYANKVTSSIPRGQGPDLFIFAHERIGDWAGSGLIRPLDNDLPADVTNTLIPSTLDAFRYKGKLYGVPLAFKSVALIYNKALVLDPPKTTDEMLAIAESFSDPAQGRFGLVYEAGSFYHHACWMYGFGGGVFDATDHIAINMPGNAKSMDFVLGMISQGIIPKEPTSVLVSQLFNEGKAAMVINGPWFMGEVDKSIDYGVATLPVVSATGKPATPFVTVEGAIVSAYSKQPEKVLAFARFLATGEGARLRIEKGKQLSADASVYALSDLDIDPRLISFKAQANQAVPMPNDPRMRMVWEPAARALRSVLRGAENPQEALDKAQQRLAVLTQDPPPEKSSAPYLTALGVILVAFVIFGIIIGNSRRIFSSMVKSRHAYYYLLPAAISMLLLVFIPFIVGTAVAFFAHRNGEFTFVGLANFVNIITSADTKITDPLSFYFTLGVTVMWTAINVALHVSIGLSLAMLLRHKWLKLRGIYRVLLIVPWAVPNYITALIWKGMFHSQFGAINGLLKFLGLEPVSWFSHFWTSFAANVTTNTWLGFPFMMVVCLGALQAIPKDLEEAAAMDGAGAWTRFHRVVLPQIKPALLPAVILGSVWTFNMFNIIYLVSGGEPDGATEILISEAYRWAFTRQEHYGYAAAYATLIFLVLIAYSGLTRRLTGKEEAA